MIYRSLVCFLFFAFGLNCFGQENIDVARKSFKQTVLLDYWGDYIPDTTIIRHSLFFNSLLSLNELVLSDINKISAFPIHMEELEGDKYNFEFCLINFKWINDGNSCNLVYILNNNLELLDSKNFEDDVYENEVNIYASDVLPHQDADFRYVIFKYYKASMKKYQIEKEVFYSVKRGKIKRICKQKRN